MALLSLSFSLSFERYQNNSAVIYQERNVRVDAGGYATLMVIMLVYRRFVASKTLPDYSGIVQHGNK